jgi:hypothetical protein
MLKINGKAPVWLVMHRQTATTGGVKGSVLLHNISVALLLLLLPCLSAVMRLLGGFDNVVFVQDVVSVSGSTTG